MSKNISTTPPVSCTLCPRRCGADRAAGQTGFCGAGGTLKAARAALHFWEEPCISGTRGSGTVFFSGCTLKCCFCQNYPISAEGLGKEITIEHLAGIFLGLQKQAPTTSTSSPPASGGPGSSRRWTLPGPRGCVCPSSATPAATRRWRAWRRGAALSTSGWPI